MTYRAGRIALAGLLAVAVLAGAGRAAARGWNVRLTGGWAAVDGGDFAAGLRGLNDMLRGEYGLVGGSLRPPRTGFDLQVEVEAEIAPRISLALGLGYLRAERTTSVEYDYWIVRSQEEIRPALSAVPLMLTAGVRLPVWRRLSLRASGGPGLYFLRARWDRDYSISAGLAADAGSEAWSASAVRVGVQGQLGFEFALGARLAAVLEAGGRWVRWSGARGPWTLAGSDGLSGDYGASGPRTLWRYDLNAGDMNYPLWILSDGEPQPARASGVGPARIDLSGLALRAGIRLSL